MSTGTMHANEVPTNEALVRRLLEAQFPEWAELPIRRVPSAGTDNALYRLGDDLAVRLPRIDWAVPMVDKECEWLPQLARQLPLATPVPLAKGAPGDGYPWHWSVCRWLDGENATLDRLTDPIQAATALAAFITALQGIDATDGPPPGPHNVYRGNPLAERDMRVRESIATLDDSFDTETLLATWEAALAAPVWDGPPIWIHGDLQSGNLLAVDGRLSAVIDFGCLGAGDPACDMMAAWTVFSAESRAAFRAALTIDDATWERGRGWAVTTVGAIPYYTDTNPVLANIARRTLAEVITDVRDSGGGIRG